MTWKARFTNDTDDVLVGTMTATFTDPDTQEAFTFSRRFKDGEDIQAFAGEAQEALAEHVGKKEGENAIALKLESILNA